MSLLVVGSVGLDTVETPFGQVQDVLGGAASYFSLAASRLTPVRMVGVVGADMPDAHIDMLRQNGVDVEGLQRDEHGKTFRWQGRYDFDLNVAHTLDTQLNVFATFKPSLPASYLESAYVYLANITPDLQLDVREQVRGAQFVGLDSMNFWIGQAETRAVLARVIQRVHAVFMNDAEVRQYTGKANLFEAARQVLAEGPRVVIIKKGEHGSLAIAREGVFVGAAYPLESVKDPTGAGDSFAGGFMGYLARTDDTSWENIKRAMVFGAVLASFAVEDFSVDRLLRLSPEELVERYQAIRQCTAFEAPLAST